MPRARKRRNGLLFKSAEWFGWALGGLEREIAETRERLSWLTAQAAKLRARVGASRGVALARAATKPTISRRKRSRMSAEGRKRISEMMKKRWAEAKKKNRNRL